MLHVFTKLGIVTSDSHVSHASSPPLLAVVCCFQLVLCTVFQSAISRISVSPTLIPCSLAQPMVHDRYGSFTDYADQRLLIKEKFLCTCFCLWKDSECILILSCLSPDYWPLFFQGNV